MPLEPLARRRLAAALLLAVAIMLPAVPASPMGHHPDLAPDADRVTFCSGTAIPRPAAGVTLSGAAFSEVSRSRICFSSTEVHAASRVQIRLFAGPTFSGDLFATFGEGSVGGTFVAGELVAGRDSVTLDVAKGNQTLVLFAGYWAAMGQGGQTLRPFCFPPIEDPGCTVAIPVPFVWAGIGPVGAVGDAAAEVSIVR